MDGGRRDAGNAVPTTASAVRPVGSATVEAAATRPYRVRLAGGTCLRGPRPRGAGGVRDPRLTAFGYGGGPASHPPSSEPVGDAGAQGDRARHRRPDHRQISTDGKPRVGVL